LRLVGFLSLDAGCRNLVPLLLFNGTHGDGARVNVSPLDGDEDSGGRTAPPSQPVLTPDSHDLLDVLCPGQDVPLFTAAFLSARFPFVTPAGHLPHAPCTPASHETLDIVDGGYHDNSGASQVGEVWAALAPMVAHVNRAGTGPIVRPVLIEVDTGEGNVPMDGLDPPGAQAARGSGGIVLGQVLRPLATALSNQPTDAAAALRTSVAAFAGGAGVTGQVVTFRLGEHPGRRLPLGWVLDDESARDIRRQLDLCVNQQAARVLAVTPPHPVPNCLETTA
jgi:hypothetical protein